VAFSLLTLSALNLVLQKANGCTVPREGYAMIRYHSCYPWHTGGAYRELMNQDDHEMLKWVLEFNKFDLYTKDDTPVDVNFSVEAVWPYYQGLIDKYFPKQDLDW
jgi:inositol oxygenase